MWLVLKRSLTDTLARPISHRLFIFGTSFSEFIKATREVEEVINLGNMFRAKHSNLSNILI